MNPATHTAPTAPLPARRSWRFGGPLASLGTAALLALATATAQAQYRVFDWVNFNDGKLPPSLSMGHDATAELVTPVNLSGAGMPAEIFSDVAKTECGPYSLSFKPSPKLPHLSVLSPLALDRNLLGDQGRALFQADFFLPAEGTVASSMSLLAAFDEKGERRAYKWYRFGTMPDKGIVFFAFVNGTEKPALFHTQRISSLKLQRPGWNRFQIVFEGRERIVCAVNGNPTAFPAITEGTLRMLNAGVMVTHPAVTPEQEALVQPGIIDNLSIQYTPQAAEFPDAPWTKNREVVFDTTTGEATLLDPASGLKWYDNTADAWSAAKTQQKPILVLWYTPRSVPFEYLESLMPKDAATRALLNNYVLLRIDVNQLAGGSIAQKRNIVRVPTLMVMTPDAVEQRRLAVISNQTKVEDVLGLLKAG